MNRKLLSIVVSIIMIVFTFIFNNYIVFADSERDLSITNQYYQRIKAFHITTPQNEHITETKFEEVLERLAYDRGYPVYNARFDIINPFVAADYNFIVYGLPHGGFYPSKDGKFQKDGVIGEYQYLGYDFTGVPIPNDKYHNPYSKVSYFKSANDYINKKWIKPIGAYHSWMSITKQELDYIKNYPFIDDDYIGTNTPPTLGEIFKDKELFSYCYLLYTPKFFDWGMVSTQYYKPNGNIDYNTLLLKPIQENMYPDMDIVVTLNTDKDTFTVSSSETELKINVNITVNINNLDLKYLDSISFSVNGQSIEQEISEDIKEYSKNLEILLDCSKLIKGKNTIKLDGSVKIRAFDYSKHLIKVSRIITVLVE
jgi:hypothetical protein